MKRIKRFGVLQTAKVAAVIYFVIAAIFILPIVLIMSAIGADTFPGFPISGAAFFIIIPFFYSAIAFVMTAICCWVYNVIAGSIGGIEVEVETTDMENL